ncbi:hypothetical protein K501DRAFT_199109 [Backusella circina FSU 941]|nr:hypothetical protein K501DRAFT_199109 [Backusella circina FSU 941]
MTRLSLFSIAFATFCAFTLAKFPHVDSLCKTDLKVWSHEDLDSISGCTTFDGSILIEKTGNWDMQLHGVETVTGSIILRENVDLQVFSAPDLQSVHGDIHIEQNTALSVLDLPRLTDANAVSLIVVPSLDRIDFPAGLSHINSLRIEDSKAEVITGLTATALNSLILTNNNFMTRFEMPSVTKINGNLLVVGNNAQMVFDAKVLSELSSASFFNLGGLSMPSLYTITSDISFHQNHLSSITLESLNAIGGQVIIAQNELLKTLNFPTLTSIQGALSIGNNSALETIEGFPQLTEIGGLIDFAGSFNDYKFPVLQEVRGGVRVQTSSSKFECGVLDQTMRAGGVNKGTDYSCTAGLPGNKLDPVLNQIPNIPKPEVPKPEEKSKSLDKPLSPGTPNISDKSAGSAGSSSSGVQTTPKNARKASGADTVVPSSILALAAGFAYVLTL